MFGFETSPLCNAGWPELLGPSSLFSYNYMYVPHSGAHMYLTLFVSPPSSPKANLLIFLGQPTFFLKNDFGICLLTDAY